MNTLAVDNKLLQSLGPTQFIQPWPSWMPRLAFSPPRRDIRGDVLVVVFLRGAADTLNMVIPHGDDAYYRLRPSLGIPHPDDHRSLQSERVIDLDGFFGLHPALKPLLPAWQSRHLAFIHACGAPDESRSHFRAMELMERGVSDESGPASGWIGRHLALLEKNAVSPLRAVALGEMPQRSLLGSVPITTLRSIADYHLGNDPEIIAQMQAALTSLYRSDDPEDQMGVETLKIYDTLSKLEITKNPPGDEFEYPDSDFGRGLRQISLLVRSEVGLEVAAIDLGGWDTHFAQGSIHGHMPVLIEDLAKGLAAFYADLQDKLSNLTLVVMTEFGRRAYENASLGTDHGHAGMMMLMGGNILGGAVHGSWPGLGEGQLFGPGDLAVTTDYRDILFELCSTRLLNPTPDLIFPGYRPKIRGLFNSIGL